ncbi:four helix bundle protein, partial [candidate division WOR-3 bacterium]|nr:four helix bundle protein [candidate division WOR-3 bacterium]
MKQEPLLAPQCGYRNLKSFQVAELLYDVTARFCNRYVDPRSRTHDQMVQAARSGVQNIAEGSAVSGTSKKMELKLTNVAHGSLVELGRDYEDHLRQRGMEIWRMGDPRRSELIALRPTTADDVALWVKAQYQKQCRGQGGQGGRSTASTSSTPESLEALAANAALTLVVVACSLLDRQVAAQAAAFEKEGGFTE